MQEFLKIWFDGVADPSIGLWSKEGGTEWLKGIPSTEHKLPPDTYFHLNCHDVEELKKIAKKEKKNFRFVRGRSITTTVIPGLGVDIDVGDKGNGKKYFKSIDQAMDAVMKTSPSIIVSSGTGLHAYYKFEEPWDVRQGSFELEGESLEKARVCMKGWGHDVSKMLGVDVDQVFDLARVLRVPGSLHSRSGMKVEVVFEGPKRYKVEKILGTYSGGDRDTIPNTGHIEEEQYDSADIDALIRLSTRFRGLWSSPARDASIACYSMAKLMLTAGWKRGKIKSALIAWRKKNGKDLKLDRTDDWYARTISKAAGAKNDACDPVDMLRGICSGDLWSPIPERPVEEFFKSLFGEMATISKVIPKLGADCVSGEAQYRVGTPGRFFTVPPNVLMSYARFKVVLLDQAKFVLPAQKEMGSWSSFVEAFVLECDDEVSQSYATDEAMVAGSLSEYFTEASHASYESVSRLQAISSPEVHENGEGAVFFRITNMLGWVHNDLGIKINVKSLTAIASGLGYKRHEGGMWVKGE